MTKYNFHYGDLIRSRLTNFRYYVRAVAPGVCLVVASWRWSIDEPAPDGELKIIDFSKWQHFEVVQARDVHAEPLEAVAS